MGKTFDSDDNALDGKVDNANEKIARCERTEQVFVYFALRFSTGRHETRSDGPMHEQAIRA